MGGGGGVVPGVWVASGTDDRAEDGLASTAAATNAGEGGGGVDSTALVAAGTGSELVEVELG